ncbi:MAG: hypothetical protein JO235_07725 [Chroococcidiopsidaceae cyanobacterium CP_BM_RX_35]|nr:hypothetical protein [Chroococcidiopsidaceae cyanobacterium CP_BM_RX_35]
MIDQQVFLEEIGILMDWFNRDFEEATLQRLHQRLSQQLTTAEFLQAVIAVFDNCRFFPTVEEFVSAVKGDSETQALHEWELLSKAAARNDRDMVAQLSAPGQSALQLVGGLYKLGLATEEELRWLKKDFVAAWKSTSTTNVRSFSPSLTVDLHSTEMVQALSPKMALNGSTKAR